MTFELKNDYKLFFVPLCFRIFKNSLCTRESDSALLSIKDKLKISSSSGAEKTTIHPKILVYKKDPAVIIR